MKPFNYDDDDDWIVKTSVRNSSGGGTRFLKRFCGKKPKLDESYPF